MTTALERGEGSASRPGRSLPPGKTRYPLYRRLSGPQGRSGQVRKISPPPGLDPRTVQPVASSYTDWATQPTCVNNAVSYYCPWEILSFCFMKCVLESVTAMIQSLQLFDFDFLFRLPNSKSDMDMYQFNNLSNSFSWCRRLLMLIYASFMFLTFWNRSFTFKF